jgi:hypothetical protein
MPRLPRRQRPLGCRGPIYSGYALSIPLAGCSDGPDVRKSGVEGGTRCDMPVDVGDPVLRSRHSRGVCEMMNGDE